jgi:hypothetical protein
MNEMENNEKSSSQQTAKKAVEILCRYDEGFKEPTKKQKNNLLIAFAKKKKVIYGNAFDIIKVTGDVDLDNEESISNNINNITIYEIKSTGREDVEDEFKGYFFGLTTAELLVAQNLKKRYKFAFVNTKTEKILELSLSDIFEKAEGIYPTWSIRF